MRVLIKKEEGTNEISVFTFIDVKKGYKFFRYKIIFNNVFSILTNSGLITVEGTIKL